jgi:Glycosyl hydrolase family 99
MRYRSLVAGLVIVLLSAMGARAAAAAPPSGESEPVLAYYYIWFDKSSWRRAKTDYPLLGRYSSDDVRVLRKHVKWAKQAGISGFIVSWKSTQTLDRRLAKLVAVARSEHFKLGIIYQGLNFERKPLPAPRVARDLRWFARQYGADPVFDVFGKPLVIWSGTWKFSPAKVAAATAPVRHSLLVLASERSTSGYERLASSVDGDAYYWSSVDPSTYPGYEEKLSGMARAVHAHQGLWIAPAAPGFDARKIGGVRVVPRYDGETLRREVDAAVQSSPDAVGLISWNEFSENSHVEPSVQYGRRYIDILADIRGAHFSSRSDLDSSDARSGIGYGLPILTGLIGVIFAALLVAFTRRHIAAKDTGPKTTGPAET